MLYLRQSCFSKYLHLCFCVCHESNEHNEIIGVINTTMKTNSSISRALLFKYSFFKSGFRRRTKFVHRFYGTSSKPADSNLNSKLSWFSFLKASSDSVLPAFWKSLKVTTSALNHVFSSAKITESPDKKLVNAASSSDHQILNFKNSISDYSEKNTDTTLPQIPLKEEKDGSYLEQAFFDWLNLSSAKERRKEFLEKSEKPVIKRQNSVVSKTSLQQRSRFLVHSLKEAVSPASQLIRLEEVCKHLLLYRSERGEMCSAGLRKILLSLKYRSYDDAVKAEAQQALTLIGYHPPPGGRGIRILSIDGGGTRGIMAIEILRQLEAQTNKKVYELFDYICGVSSGGILSLLLGGLRFSLDECESLYRTLSDKVFSQSTIWGTGRLMWSHAYYDTTMWVDVLKKTFGEKLLIEISKSEDSPKIGVISAIMNLPRLQPFVFRNYDFDSKLSSEYLGSCQYLMWESIRASGAAPGYFEEYCLDDYLHQDGGIMVNNSTAVAIHEAKLLWPSEPIQCVVSLGCGRFYNDHQLSYTSTSLKTKVLKIIDSATDTEAVHIILSDLLPRYTYFRLNPYMTEFLTLDENREEKLDQMKKDAQMYLQRNDFKFTECMRILCSPRSHLKKAIDWLTIRKHLYLF